MINQTAYDSIVNRCTELHIDPPPPQQLNEIYLYIAQQIASLHDHQQKTVIIGIHGPQGSGKSTLCEFIQLLLEYHFNKHVVTLSLDDLYKTKTERQQMAATVHPLFATRGVPGTHDVTLGIETLATLQSLGDNQTMQIPKFNKSLDDRLPQSNWPTVKGPIDIVLFEGWCIAALPQTEDELAQPINELESTEDMDGSWRTKVNDYLQSDYQKLFTHIDLLIVILIESFDVVYQNRLQQERTLAKQTGTMAMDEQQIKRFIQFYQRITEHSQLKLPKLANITLKLLNKHHFKLD